MNNKATGGVVLQQLQEVVVMFFQKRKTLLVSFLVSTGLIVLFDLLLLTVGGGTHIANSSFWSGWKYPYWVLYVAPAGPVRAALCEFILNRILMALAVAFCCTLSLVVTTDPLKKYVVLPWLLLLLVQALRPFFFFRASVTPSYPAVLLYARLFEIATVMFMLLLPFLTYWTTKFLQRRSLRGTSIVS